MIFKQKTPYQRIAGENEIWCENEMLGGKVRIEREFNYAGLMHFLICSSEKGDVYLIELKSDENIIAKIDREMIRKLENREIATSKAFKMADEVFLGREKEGKMEVEKVDVQNIKRKLPEKGVYYAFDLPLMYEQQRKEMRKEKRGLARIFA